MCVYWYPFQSVKEGTPPYMTLSLWKQENDKKTLDGMGRPILDEVKWVSRMQQVWHFLLMHPIQWLLEGSSCSSVYLASTKVKIKLLDEGIVPAWLDLHYLQVFAGALVGSLVSWNLYEVTGGHTQPHGFNGAISKSVESVHMGQSLPSQFHLSYTSLVAPENLQVEFHLATWVKLT